MFDKSFWKV